MISFDLECSRGHSFEGWFDSLKAFEEQIEKKIVSCPICNETEIKRIFSPVAFKFSGNKKPMIPDNFDYKRLAETVINYIHEHSDNVGTKFTTEALKMHYGVTESRSILGSATDEEEKILKKEGIEFFKLPSPEKKDPKH